MVVLHFLPSGCGFLFVNPVGLEPMVMGDETKVNFAGNNIRNTPIKIMCRVNEGKSSKIAATYFLKSSENGSSFKNVQGYLYFLLNLSSNSLTLFIALSTSLFRANIRMVAFARRDSVTLCSGVM